MSFTSFGFHPCVERALRELGFEQPTPIQAQAIPPALAGRDLLASAMTGSGKTAAFVLPLLKRLDGRRRGVTRALVLAPTRELAQQIEQDFRSLARHTPHSCASVIGGMGMGLQERAFRRGVDVIVATPGRLLDHLRAPYARLDGVEVVVLDEADRMLDLGFLPDVRRVLQRLPAERQTLLFSATLPGPIQELAGEMLRDPVHVRLAAQPAPAKGVTHSAWPVPAELKAPLLVELLRRGQMRSVIAFTRTKQRANRLAEYLERNGVRAGRIHGNRSQSQRDEALRAFKAGRFPVLVATDLAARGIHVEALSHVVNFDVPHCSEDYVHRVGRTARADAKGDAFVFFAPDEERRLVGIERTLGTRVPRLRLEGFDYAARPVAPPPNATRPAAREARTHAARPTAWKGARRSAPPSRPATQAAARFARGPRRGGHSERPVVY
jgi:ATP-dependent RNA helicase RhlE